MLERYLQGIACVFPDPANEKEALAPIVATLPARAVRRMSRLGILLSHVLEGMPVNPQATLVYATTHSETSALESYLDSLPYASPTAFQTSIHPGGVEQALILKQQPVGALIPLAGEDQLFLRALQCVFVSDTPEAVLCGGEEQGTWLQSYRLSYSCSYAYAIHLSIRGEGALGKVSWDPLAEEGDSIAPSLGDILRLMQRRETLNLAGPSLGRFAISWP